MISVMVAEDSIEQNSNCCSFLTKDKEIEIISRTLDGLTTINEYLKLRPDVLLLDLNMPKFNGVQVIDNLCLDSYERKKCNIIIISGNSELKHSIYNTSKIYKILPKPVDYNILIETIKDIGENSKELTRNEIKKLQFDLKFNMYSKGSRYVADAIEFAYKDIDLLSNMTELYKKVAVKNEIKVNKIQRSIRSSIDVMNEHITKEQLRSFFHIYDNDTITPKYFFVSVIDYFRELKGK